MPTYSVANLKRGWRRAIAQNAAVPAIRGTWLYDAMGHGYFFLGDYEKAIEISKKALHQDPSVFGAFVTLACAYAQQGRGKEAKYYVEELLRQVPRYSLQALRKNPMFVDAKLAEKLVSPCAWQDYQSELRRNFSSHRRSTQAL